MKKKTGFDLSKYFDLSSEDRKALGIVESDRVGVDMAKGQDRTVVFNPAFGAPYVMKRKCVHRVSLRELPDYKMRRLPNDVWATAHACLECGDVLWRVHPGPRRLNRKEAEEVY